MSPDTLPNLVRAGLAGATAFAMAFALTPLVRSLAVQSKLIGRPAHDRWGKRAVARLGGVAIFLGIVVSTLLWVPLEPPVVGLLGGLFLVFVVGLMDDIRRMRPYTKLLLQLAVGSMLVWTGIRVELIRWPWLAIPLTVFWFVFVMNAFNLLDNMDGLAAGVGAIAAGFCVAHAAFAGRWIVAILGMIVSGACLGFLRYNFPPAKIFMGDSGSHVLGLSLGALALLGSWHHSTQLVSVLAIPVLVLAVPIFDMCFVTVQRLVNGRHPFEGGTDHVSHRLAILGLSERQTVVLLYGLSVALGAFSLLLVMTSPLGVVTLWLALLAALLLAAGYLAKVRVYTLGRGSADAPAATAARPVTEIETALFHKRRILEVLIDFVVICGAYVGAHLLRFEGGLVESQRRLLVQSLPVIIAVQLGSFALVRLYRGVWRYVSIPDLLTILKGVTLGAVFGALAVLYLWRFEGFSRAVFVIDWLLLFIGVSAARLGERLFNEWLARAVHGVPAVIIGAGDMGELVLRQCKHDRLAKRQVIGFLDDDPAKEGVRIHGIKVLGARTRLPHLIAEGRIGEVVVAMEDPPRALLDFVQRHCEPAGVKWQVVQTLFPATA